MTETQLKLGSIGHRFVALLLDALILAIPSFLASRIIPVFGHALIWFFYAPILESSKAQATVGKYVMGLQVTNLKGAPLSLKDSLIRNLLKIISSLMLGLGYFVALISDKKQGLHDMLADSVVVEGKTSLHLWDVWLEATKSLFSSIDSVKGSASRVVNSDSKIERLEKLFELRKAGALTEDEYQAQKEKILTE